MELTKALWADDEGTGNVEKSEEPRSDSAFSLALKRCFDLLFGLVAMVIFTPLFAVISVMIRAEDGGPVIFRQERVGRKGRHFTILKFRSMHLEAEEEGMPLLCSEADDRLTRMGEFLRNHHLDELPQLWNVVRGDMSFVGYRPERPYFVERIIAQNPDYRQLYALRPGLFSLATLYNGYTDTMEKMLRRLEMDLDYVRHRSLWLDVKIIALTTWAIVGGRKF